MLPNVLVENDNKPETCAIETVELQQSHKFFQPEQYQMGANSEKDEDIDYLLNEPYPSVPDDLALNEELFLEANDLSNPAESDPTGFDLLEEYLTFFDADDNLHLDFEPSDILGSEEPISGQAIPEEVIFPSMS